MVPSSRLIANRHDKFIKSESQRTNLLTFINMYRQLLLVKYMSYLCVSVFLSFSFFRFLIKYFQLCICIDSILLPFVVNKLKLIIFQDSGRTPSWIFLNFKFLMVVAVKSVELHLCAKFCQNRLNSDRNMAIFYFSKMAAVSRPPSWICNACVGTTHEGHLVVFITVQNLVGNWCSIFDNMHV